MLLDFLQLLVLCVVIEGTGSASDNVTEESWLTGPDATRQYLFVGDKITCDSGRKICKNDYGASLVTIFNDEENNFISQLSLNNTSEPRDYDDYIWFGCECINRSCSWPNHDYSQFPYNNWKEGEPNEMVPGCCTLNPGNGKWSDTWSKDNRSFICQKDVRQLVSDVTTDDTMTSDDDTDDINILHVSIAAVVGAAATAACCVVSLCICACVRRRNTKRNSSTSNHTTTAPYSLYSKERAVTSEDDAAYCVVRIDEADDNTGATDINYVRKDSERRLLDKNRFKNNQTDGRSEIRNNVNIALRPRSTTDVELLDNDVYEST